MQGVKVRPPAYLFDNSVAVSGPGQSLEPILRMGNGEVNESQGQHREEAKYSLLVREMR